MMLKLIVRRALSAIPVIICVLSISFLFARLVPGGPFDKEVVATDDVMAAIRSYYGYDKHVVVQYFDYFKKLFSGDLGPSMRYQGCSVNELLRERIPVSLELGSLAMIVSAILGTSIGVLSAIKQNTAIDRLIMGACLLGISLPSFVVGPLLILVFGINLKVVNAVGWDSFSDKILPTITLACMYSGYVARLARSSFLDVLKQNFIRTAMAKGLSPRRIIIFHALKNAIAPVVTYLAPTAAAIMSGSLVIEALFNIPGAGSLFITAVGQRDYSLILGCILYLAVLIISLNLIVDVCLILINPLKKTTK